MDKVELQNRLISENIVQHLYSFKDVFPNEAICLIEVNGEWEVYYSERGNKNGLRVFKNEEEACQFFYDWTIKDLKDGSANIRRRFPDMC